MKKQQHTVSAALSPESMGASSKIFTDNGLGKQSRDNQKAQVNNLSTEMTGKEIINKSFAQMMHDASRRLVPAYIDGKKQSVTVLQAVLQEITNSALRGDRRAQKLLLENCARASALNQDSWREEYNLELLSEE